MQLIHASKSPHSSPAFMVMNRAEQGRGKARMVIDYRQLNDKTIDDAYKIPNKSACLNKARFGKIFSKFDLKSGFWQIKIEESSIHLTAFTCPKGLFEWMVLPFGLKQAPLIFQRKMDRIFLMHIEQSVQYYQYP
ncbi:hypothetical protein Patl1_34263 [Pistacia atlantica]|uniref:Uncharacterized protein n=1 Tax=Pistacia atlantica TaxID=434234 RepID=A0ACC0ZSW5_9ROSI|nr:hypothetical protein Patl1_34263 [Pistacia atlantica]